MTAIPPAPCKSSSPGTCQRFPRICGQVVSGASPGLLPPHDTASQLGRPRSQVPGTFREAGPPAGPHRAAGHGGSFLKDAT